MGWEEWDRKKPLTGCHKTNDKANVSEWMISSSPFIFHFDEKDTIIEGISKILIYKIWFKSYT